MATNYDFYYQYKDGSYYLGTVSDNGYYNYYVGEQISNGNGFYDIYGSSGATAQTPGTVNTSYYYDTSSKQTYTPYYTSLGLSDGSSGLGSETDYTYATTDGYKTFGQGGTYEAKHAAPSTLYNFYYQYNDGSYYLGTVSDNGSHNYYSGDKIATGNGFYYIYGSSGTTTQASGAVNTSSYYDSSSKQTYTPYFASQGLSDGSGGLGSETDYTYAKSDGYKTFGQAGAYEAKHAGASTLYNFYYQYNDGSYYLGTVADNGSHSYYSGDKIATGNGFYYIYGSSGTTTQASGAVSTSTYYDSSSKQAYTPYFASQGLSDGSGGLGSETDYTYATTDGYKTFGQAGTYEAKHASASTLYNFYYQYNDGSYYLGTVADNGSHNYYSGDKLATSNGFYYIYGSSGTTTQASGAVSTSSYYDSSSKQSYMPYFASQGLSDGSGGLGSETDYTYNATDGYKTFGQAGTYEAKHTGASTLYDFYYQYNDGSYYLGTVADNGSNNYYSGEKIANGNGFYNIYASAGTTTQASGTVNTSSYYDVTSGSSYTPYFASLGKSDGLSGLGSELDYTHGLSGYQAFGMAGSYEAKQY